MTQTKRTRKLLERPSVALLYIRVSTGQQAESGLSLEHQEQTLRQSAAGYGFAEVVVLREEGISGKSLRNRPALQQGLDMLAKGEAAALLVSKMDRLSRSTADTLHLAGLADRQGWRLLSLDLGLDTATPTGRLVLTMLAAVAEMERSRISERHVSWHAAKRERGLVWGVNEGQKALLPDSVRRRIVTERASGRSLRAIAEGLTSDGIPTAKAGTWHASTIAAVLRSPSLSEVTA